MKTSSTPPKKAMIKPLTLAQRIMARATRIFGSEGMAKVQLFSALQKNREKAVTK